MIFDVTYMLDVLRQIIPYTPITLFLAIASMMLAGVFGLGIALIKQFQIPVLKQIVTVYVSFFRSIPTIVELFLIYYGLPQIFPVFSKMEALSATILGLSLKNAAYLSEIFRAGLLSVDDGQMEACIGVGISKTYAYQHIILPQAFQNALPGMSNTFISLIKESSLAFSLGLVDLFAQAKLIASDSFRFFEAYLAVAIIFWVLVVILTLLQQRLEAYMQRYR